MPTTRSASKRQQTLDDYGLESHVKSSAPTSASTHTDTYKSQGQRSTYSPVKCKHAANHTERPSKRSKPKARSANPTKQTQHTDDNADIGEPILINRAPVLTLWAATVAHFLYPDEHWTTCLSMGGSVSSLCAISKGRAIGRIEPKDDATESEDKNKKESRKTKNDERELEIMGFPMQIDAGGVVVNAKKKPVNEHLLQAKYGGEEEYTRVKQTMERALQIWEDDKEQLDKKAFRMYERFRPSIATGSAGWGRKGPLDLHKVKSTIESRS